MSEKEIVEIVARYLKDKHPGGATLEALAQGVRHEQGWWYVPVRPSFEPPHRYKYYEALADIEGALEDAEHLTVLSLPTFPASKSWDRTRNCHSALKTSCCRSGRKSASGGTRCLARIDV